MDTLLAMNNSAALVGDLEGKVRTEIFPSSQSLQDRKEWLQQHYERPKHTKKSEEYLADTTDVHLGPLIPTEKPNVHKLPEFHEKVLINEYKDETNNLAVRAAFDPGRMEWTIADQ